LRNRTLAPGYQGANLARADLIAPDLILLYLIFECRLDFMKNNWGGLLGWFLILHLCAGGVPIFAWAYRSHLDVLTGPLISHENPAA
jgi:hypothetical protein